MIMKIIMIQKVITTAVAMIIMIIMHVFLMR